MAKAREPDFPEAAVVETHPHGHAPEKASEKKEKPGEPRVIPEYRADPTSGQAVVPTRLADFKPEQEAGWHRFKAAARQPHEATWPPAYLIAPDEKAAEKAYRDHYAVPEAGIVVVRRMPD